MPSGDRTGPRGQGPMTGKMFGFCGGDDTPGYEKRFRGRGRRFGFGGGMGRHHDFERGGYRDRPFSGYNSPHWFPDKENEIKMLKSQAEELKRAQKNIEKRLNELEKDSD